MAGRYDITRRETLVVLSAMEFAMFSIGLGISLLAQPAVADPGMGEGAVHIRDDDGDDGVLLISGDSGEEIITLRV